MAKNKAVEAYRAGMQQAGNTTGVDGTLQSTEAVLFSLQQRSFHVQGKERPCLCAQVHPVRRVSQRTLCERLARENGKYRADEYNMILNDVLRAVTTELRAGNTVSLPELGLFSVSIGGTFDPEERSVLRKYPLRAHLRIARTFNDELNLGARLRRIDGLPTVARAKKIFCSSASPEDAAHWNGPAIVAHEVRPEANRIMLEGSFRNLTEDIVAELAEIGAHSASAAVPTPLTLKLTQPPSRRSESTTVVEADTSTIRKRLLPDTRWILRIATGNEAPSELAFTVMDMPKVKRMGRA